jgi:poly(A) polymerase
LFESATRSSGALQPQKADPLELFNYFRLTKMPSDNDKLSTAQDDDDLRRRLERRRERRRARVELRGVEVEQPRKKLPKGRRVRWDEGETREAGSGRERRAPPVGPEPVRIPVKFDPAALDDAAEKVVRRLTSAGHEAYLVGGCVRDLLVGHRPKDFDVATSARPEEVRAIFRNSRIIGRRFRLVHVLFPNQHVIETATFRRNPPPGAGTTDEDLLIRSDNVFGDAHEDAQRRDFTINALFYDVDERVVLDWVGGMEHIQRRMVHTIGDPVVRFQEDPVRMLRAVKFAARIDFGISPEVYEAAVQCRGALAMAARPRLSEEILRLMRGGASHRSMWLLWEMGLLDILLPELSSYLADSEDSAVWGLLSEVDQLTKKKGQPLDDIILWGALLLEPLSEACDGAQDRLQAAHEFLEPVVERLNLPRRASDAVRRIVAHLPRMEQGRSPRFKKSTLYPLARQLFEMRARAVGERVETEEPEPDAPKSKGRGRPRRQSRKRSR